MEGPLKHGNNCNLIQGNCLKKIMHTLKRFFVFFSILSTPLLFILRKQGKIIDKLQTISMRRRLCDQFRSAMYSLSYDTKLHCCIETVLQYNITLLLLLLNYLTRTFYQSITNKIYLLIENLYQETKFYIHLI